MDNKEMKKLNPEEVDQVAGGNIFEDVADIAGKAVNAVGDAFRYLDNQIDMYEARAENTEKLDYATKKNKLAKH